MTRVFVRVAFETFAPLNIYFNNITFATIYRYYFVFFYEDILACCGVRFLILYLRGARTT